MIGLTYKDEETAVHRLNPFCKLAWLCSVFVLALTLDNPLFLLLLFAATLPSIAAARLLREWVSLMKFTLLLCLAIIVVNILVNYNGSHVLVEAPFRIPVMGIPKITLEAIFYGIGMAIRLLTIVSAFAVIMYTIHPDDMMLSMTKMKLPYKSVLVTSLSTRFFPTLLGDAERIADAQRSRGLELDRGRLLRRVRRRVSLLIPLLSNSLDRTVQVAEAMEARAFGSGSRRSFYKDIAMTRFDVVTLALCLAPCGLAFFMLVRGYGDYQYYPSLGGLHLGGLEWSMLPILCVLLSSMALLALMKKRVDLD